MLSVGQGIIGSAAEENSRKRVEWATGSSYFLPCSKGIACGWIHKLDESGNSTETYDNKKADSSDDGEREVIVYALKVSPETLLSMDDNLPDSMSPWVKMSHNLFSKCIANLSAKRTETEEDDRITNEKTNCVNENPIEGISMSAIESVNVRDIIRLVEEEDVL